MEYKHVAQLHRVAEIHVEKQPMSRDERLARWIALLEREPGRMLRTLGQIEYKTVSEQEVMRADGSPLTIAFDDPVLRAEGLRSDRLGDAIAFFGLSEAQAHRLLCSCWNGPSVSAYRTTRRLDAILDPMARVRAVAYVAATALVAVPALIYLFG